MVLLKKPACAQSPGFKPLSPRELQVAAWLGEDDTYARIADRLNLKTDTVRNHARAIERKLGVQTRHAAVARLIQHGIPCYAKRGD